MINISWQKLLVVAAVSAVLYDSWPLGYWLNPAVGRHGLASDLEGLHQPFNWVFIGGDVVSSILAIILVVLLWFGIRRLKAVDLLEKLALSAIVMFAIGTIVDALLPLHCNPSLQSCPSFRHDPLLLAHGIFSIAASVALFVAMAILWWRDRRSGLLLGIIIGYAVFGMISLLEALYPVQNNWSQHYYITLCSLCLLALPYIMLRSPHQTGRALLAHRVKSLRGA